MTLKIRDKVVLLSVLLLIATAGIVVEVFYSGTRTILVENTIDEMKENLRTSANSLKGDLQALRNDVRFLSTMPPIQGIIRGTKGKGYDAFGKSTMDQWRQRLEVIFRQFLISRPAYFKVRYIGIANDGKELVRVDRTVNGPQPVAVNELQAKSNRAYFQKSLALSAGRVYFSDVSLNREHGEIVIPHVPVLRAVTPVFSPEGVLFGFMVISMEFGDELVQSATRFQELGQTMYMTNSDGEYLYHPDKKKRFGFEFDKTFRFQDDFPEATEFLIADLYRNDIEVFESTDGKREVNSLIKVPISMVENKRFIMIALTEEYSRISSRVTSLLTTMLWPSLLLIIFGSLLAFWYSGRLIKPLALITKGVESFRVNRGQVELPVDNKDELGVLARAFHSLFEHVNENQALLEQAKKELEFKVEERTRNLQDELTIRQKTEQELAGSEARIRAVIENVVDGIIIIDDQGAIESVNPATEKIFGYSEREMVGRNVKMLMPEPYHSEHDGYMEHYLTTGEKRVIGIGREVMGRRGDGSVFPMELGVSEIKIDNKIKFSGIVRDISERHEDEQQIRDSEARNRAIFETVVDGIITIDDQGIIETANPAAEKLFGYSLREMVGRNVKMLMPEPYHSEHDGYMSHYLNTGEKRVIGIGREVEGRHSDGTIFPMDLAVNEMMIGNKRMFTGIVRNITERKKAEKLKNEFVSTVSHELRTPLTSIRGSLGLLVGGAIEGMPEKATALLEIAHNNTERLLLLINDILDIEKIESGQMAFNFSEVDAMDLVKKTILSNQAYADQFKAYYTVSRSIDSGKVYADPDRITQVMSNLMSNAAKFSPEGAAIEIAVAKHAGNIRISVSDHGPGIPESFRKTIFDKFTQSDSSDTRQVGGTGLGLNITKAIVEKHGGRIDFVTKEGVGTTFFFDLPEIKGGQSMEGLAKTLSISGRRKSIRKILIVEDDDNVASLLQIMLAEDGYDSDIAVNASEAKQMLDEHKYMAMTLDIMLPDKDGLTLLRELRAEAETRDLPIVVISAKADISKRQINGKAMDVVDWLDKPIDNGRLVTAVQQAVSLSAVPNILHVEDDVDVSQVVASLLEGHATVVSVGTADEASEKIANEQFDLILLDVGLPGKSGLELLDELLEREVSIPVIIFSAQDVDAETLDKVNAILVKSSTSNKKLVDTITEVLQK